MPKLTKEQLVYMTDDMYTPIHYKSGLEKEPFYKGK
jgi:hypothetical protein